MPNNFNKLRLAMVAAMLGTAAQAFAYQYRLTDLGTLGAGESAALGVNDAGQIVGWRTADNGLSHATMWQNGAFVDLHATTGLDQAGHSVATAINASGQIVGGASFSNAYFHAAMWQGGSVQDLDGNPRAEGAAQSLAYAINNRGEVVGTRNSAFSGTSSYYAGEAFRWAPAPETPPPFPPLVIPGVTDPLSPNGMKRVYGYRNVYGEAFGINDSGAVVGYSGMDGYAIMNDGMAIHVAGPLSDMYGGASFAYDINNKGLAVGIAHGTFFPGMTSAAVIWNGETMTALDGMRVATAINDAGQVVGHDFGGTSYLYQNGQLVDLATLIDPASGSFSGKALAISENGTIVGQLANGHAFVLTPVPEPATTWLTLTGLVCLAWGARRRAAA